MLDFGDKDEHIDVQAVASGGRKIAYVYSTSAKLPEYYVADLQYTGQNLQVETPVEWIRLNDGLRKKGTTRSEVMR